MSGDSGVRAPREDLVAVEELPTFQFELRVYGSAAVLTGLTTVHEKNLYISSLISHIQTIINLLCVLPC